MSEAADLPSHGWLRTRAVLGHGATGSARLDRALGNLVKWRVSLPMAGGWSKMILLMQTIPGNDDFMINQAETHAGGC